MPTSSNKSRKRSANSAARPIAGARASAQAVAVPAPIKAARTQATAPVQAAPPSNLRRAWDFLRGPYPTLVSRAVLGVIFLTFGVSKAFAIPAFASDITAYKMLPDALIIPLATLLPLAEILVAVFLLLGLRTRWAALGSGAMIFIFEIAILSAMARHLQIECGCFGNVDVTALKSLRDTVGWRKVIEDAIYLALSAHLFFVPTIFALDQRQK